MKDVLMNLDDALEIHGYIPIYFVFDGSYLEQFQNDYHRFDQEDADWIMEQAFVYFFCINGRYNSVRNGINLFDEDYEMTIMQDWRFDYVSDLIQVFSPYFERWVKMIEQKLTPLDYILDECHYAQGSLTVLFRCYPDIYSFERLKTLCYPHHAPLYSKLPL